jgi:hypothetical protein
MNNFSKSSNKFASVPRLSKWQPKSVLPKRTSKLAASEPKLIPAN